MILSRYLNRDILTTTAAVALILLLIFMTGRFSRYLADAASGKISADILLTLLMYRVPLILERVLPVSLFLGILLVFGRMYVDNEVSVLNASGISLGRLLRAALGSVLVVAALVAVLSFYVSPEGYRRSEQLLNAEKRRSELDLLEPGQFLKLKAGVGVIYAGSMDDGHKLMHDVFIMRQMTRGDWVIIRAESGHQEYDAAQDARYLVLEHGVRYTVSPGSAVADQLHFGRLRQHLQPAAEYDTRKFIYDTLPTAELVGSDNPKYRATLQWRFSLVLLVVVVSVLGVGMSRTSPRQGRFFKLMPALLLYFAYMMSLDVMRQQVAAEDLPELVGLLLVHLPFMAVALAALRSEELLLWWRARA